MNRPSRAVARAAGPHVAAPRVIGRYALFEAIAAGGMASVHFGRLLGPAGFSRTVVIKRLHAHYARMPQLAAMFLDEARVAARVRHPNVVGIIDMVAEDGEVFLVMEYVHGASLANMMRGDVGHDALSRGADLRSGHGGGFARIARIGNVVAGALHGLHAAHEATGEGRRPLGVVHRDFSPQNILVGVDGTARIVDFGVAKAEGQRHHSGEGEVKGKIRYLSPEQVRCGPVDRRSDLWAASIVLWEALAGRRLFGSPDAGTVLAQVLDQPIPTLKDLAPAVPELLSRVVMRGLERDPDRRFATALDMAVALEEAVGLVPPRAIGAWVERVAGQELDERRRILERIEAEDLRALAADDDATPVLEATTNHAMVRVSTPEELARATMRPARRVPRVAWAAGAAIVAAVVGALGAIVHMGAEAPPTGVASALASTAIAEQDAPDIASAAEPEPAAPQPGASASSTIVPAGAGPAMIAPMSPPRPRPSRARPTPARKP